ncbi:uncharacterized protein LOC118500960 [Phyllostomus discolor]|uniref:Uncharacterized protein LOC118500960 n=1 Tax=Phyllostomus discolor TaxID=89673 RepID=A0A7E6DWZ5_9CHIR|nr:uncharacterized protein LOC118500960 [Phyllostomus discolor]
MTFPSLSDSIGSGDLKILSRLEIQGKAPSPRVDSAGSRAQVPGLQFEPEWLRLPPRQRPPAARRRLPSPTAVQRGTNPGPERLPRQLTSGEPCATTSGAGSPPHCSLLSEGQVGAGGGSPAGAERAPGPGSSVPWRPPAALLLGPVVPGSHPGDPLTSCCKDPLWPLLSLSRAPPARSGARGEQPRSRSGSPWALWAAAAGNYGARERKSHGLPGRRSGATDGSLSVDLPSQIPLLWSDHSGIGSDPNRGCKCRVARRQDAVEEKSISVELLICSRYLPMRVCV